MESESWGGRGDEASCYSRVQWRGAEVGGDEIGSIPRRARNIFRLVATWVLAGLTFFVVEN